MQRDYPADTKIIFFDAAGTLIRPAIPVGELYANIGRGYGFDCDASKLERSFRQAFKTMGPMVARERDASSQKEWWLDLVSRTWEPSGVNTGTAGFRSYFDEVFAHYEEADAWRVFDDVLPALDLISSRGIRAGIISNFDSRLHKLLYQLRLDQYFEVVVVSMEAGAAKPDKAIFKEALKMAGESAVNAIHIGDSYEEDFSGAGLAGLRPFLIDREQVSDLSVSRVCSLLEFVNSPTFILNE